MSTFNIAIEVGDTGGARYQQFDALVDTGSTFTVVSAAVLRDLDVGPLRREAFELADGSVQEWDVGQTWIRVAGKSGITQVVFGPDQSTPILGAETLEELLLGADPIRQRLIPMRGLLKDLGGNGGQIGPQV